MPSPAVEQFVADLLLDVARRGSVKYGNEAADAYDALSEEILELREEVAVLRREIGAKARRDRGA